MVGDSSRTLIVIWDDELLVLCRVYPCFFRLSGVQVYMITAQNAVQ